MQEIASPWLHWFPQRFLHRTDSDRILDRPILGDPRTWMRSTAESP